MQTGSPQLTAFAPPDEAVRAKLRLINGFLIRESVNSLFVEGAQPSSFFDDGDSFVSRAGLFLHVRKLEPPFSQETVS